MVWTHKGCACNELIALQQRHQVDDGSRFNPIFFPILLKHMMKLRKHCTPITKLSVAMGYSGAKRRLALEAIDSLKRDRLDLFEDAKVKMFLKDDKYHEPIVKPPRCIQYRSKRYALTLAQFTYPIEHKIYAHREKEHLCFAKGRNLIERATDLHNIWNSYVNPVAWCLDHSKFDAHVGKYHLMAARKLNAACFEIEGSKPFVKKLLRAQVNNRGVTKNGTKFKTLGTRMSGDQNTGLDNSTINYGMIKAVLEICGVDANVYIDGDDSVVIMEQVNMHKVDAKIFQNFGMVTKSEFVFDFERIDFCQTRPCYNGTEWIMCRNPKRVLDRLCWVVKKFPTSMDQTYLKSVFLCESALGEGLPVVGVLASRFASEIKLSKRKKLMDVETDYMVKQLGKDKTKLYSTLPTDDARASFHNSWGYGINEQLELEKMTMQPPADPLPMLIDHIPEAMEL